MLGGSAWFVCWAIDDFVGLFRITLSFASLFFGGLGVGRVFVRIGVADTTRGMHSIPRIAFSVV